MVGAAVELLHTAFVIHDDVIDGDDVRRGRLNVSGTFTSRTLAAGATADEAAGLGRAAGILAGDLALAAAIRAVATCGAATDVVHRLLDLFDAALHTTAAGELADVRFSLHLDPVSLAESLAMEEQKTSAYSFALPLQAGAVLAGADEHTVDRLGEAGLMLGVAFQLVDDLIGVFGDPARTGKSATSDLRTRKQTPLLVHATTTPEWDADPRRTSAATSPTRSSAEARRLLTTSRLARLRRGAGRGPPRQRPHGRGGAGHLPRPGPRRRPRASRRSPTTRRWRHEPPARPPPTRPAPSTTRSPRSSAAMVIRHYSSSFGLASLLLAKPVRTQVRNVYALVRVADEIVDNPDPALGRDAARADADLAAGGRTAVPRDRLQRQPRRPCLRPDGDRVRHRARTSSTRSSPRCGWTWTPPSTPPRPSTATSTGRPRSWA